MKTYETAWTWYPSVHGMAMAGRWGGCRHFCWRPGTQTRSSSRVFAAACLASLMPSIRRHSALACMPWSYVGSPVVCCSACIANHDCHASSVRAPIIPFMTAIPHAKCSQRYMALVVTRSKMLSLCSKDRMHAGCLYKPVVTLCWEKQHWHLPDLRLHLLNGGWWRRRLIL